MNLFEKHSGPIAIFFLWGVVSASVFGAVVIKGGSPVTPELYGPLVYSIPAWSWIASQMLICGGAFISAALGWRVMTLWFAFAFCLLMASFAVMAIQAGGTGTMMVANAGFWALPIGILVCFACLDGGRFGKWRR